MNKSDASDVRIVEIASLEKATGVKRDRPGFSRWKWLISQWGNDLKTLFLYGSEPRVYLRRDRNGQSYLKIYDPVSRETVYCNSQTEARAYLEKRYYR
ncbi:MAG: hypothetical protein ACLFV6_07090 [Spirulinaceae cyanobacterium]